MKRHSSALGPALASALLAVLPVQAAHAAQPAPAALVRTERLASLNPTPGPIELHGANGEFNLYFELSSRIDPTGAALHLELSNSQALLAPRSQLVLQLNGAVVGQIALKPGTPLTSADVELPPELLHGGSNRLTFKAAQHYTTECEDSGAAELWTQIDTSRSSLTVTGRGSTAAPSLSGLQDLIGPGLFGGGRFTLLTPTLDSPATLSTGAALSEALALRMRYRPAEIGLAEARPAPGDDKLLRLALPRTATGDLGDLVLFGTKDALAPMLGPTLAQSIGTGGFLGLYAMPGEPGRLVLVVSGSTEQDVARAATALGVANFPFVDASEETVDHVEVRPGESFFSQNALAEGSRTSFKDLGFRTATLRGQTGFASLDVTLPADLYTPDSAEAELALDFAYGAGLRSDSVVNLMLNGDFVQALALPDRGGAVLRNYRIRIPARKFHPGRNTIAFETVLTPSVSAACLPPQTRNLVLSLEDTSSIALPHGDRLASQPDLQLFSASGFPYVGSSGFDVVLAHPDPSTIAAGWTVLARLAQLAGRTLPEAHLMTGAPAGGRHTILVGAVPDLSPGMLAFLPDGVRPGHSLSYASAMPVRPERTSWLSRASSLFGMAAQAGETQERDSTLVQGRSDLGRNGLLTASRMPGSGDHTVTVLTAANRDGLWTASQDLVRPAIWFQLGKDTSLWRPGSDTVFTQRTGPIYHLGNSGTLYTARYYIGEYPGVWIVAVLGSVLLLASVLRLFLVRRRRRRLPGSVEGIP